MTWLPGLLSGLLSFGAKLISWFTASREQRVGAELQAGRDAEAAAAAEAAIAKAEMNAPRTKADALKRLRDGSA